MHEGNTYFYVFLHMLCLRHGEVKFQKNDKKTRFGLGGVDFFYFDYTKRFELKRSETERERVLKITGRIYMF